jgi:hypothetical protein
MAIDPNISLQVRPPAAANAFEPMAQAQEMQVRNLQIQNAMFENQQKRIEFQDMMNMRQVLPGLVQKYNGDYQQAFSDPQFLSSVSLRTGMQMQQFAMGLAKSKADLEKTRTDTSKTQAEVDQGHRDYAGAWGLNLKNQIGDQPPNPATVYGAIAHLAQTETDPINKQKILQVGAHLIANPDQIMPELNSLIQASPKAREDEINQLKEKREQATSAAQLPGQIATSAENRRNLAINELRGLIDPATGQLQSQAGYQDWAKRYPDFRPAPPPQPIQAYIDTVIGSKVPLQDLPDWLLRKKALTMSKADWVKELTDVVPNKGDTAALYNRTMPQMLSAVDTGDYKGARAIIKDASDQIGRGETAERVAKLTAPVKVQIGTELAGNRQNIAMAGLGTVDEPGPMAQMVADYQVPLQTVLARVPLQGRQILLDQVKALNPQFQAQYYPAFQKTEESATTGKLADSSRALNTMMGHLGTLDRAADALNNGDIQILNKIANAWGLATGKTAKTTYDTIVHRLGPEVTKAYVAGGGTSGERGTNEEDFSSNLGAQQIKQNIGISAYLADSLQKANQEQYNRGTYGRGKQVLMSDEARQIRQGLIQRVPESLRGGATRRAIKEGDTAGRNIIRIGNKRYQYKGTGATTDLSNYTEIH